MHARLRRAPEAPALLRLEISERAAGDRSNTNGRIWSARVRRRRRGRGRRIWAWGGSALAQSLKRSYRQIVDFQRKQLKMLVRDIPGRPRI